MVSLVDGVKYLWVGVVVGVLGCHRSSFVQCVIGMSNMQEVGGSVKM